MEIWKYELYHHGILGQKWGKRNGPPYPLGKGQYSKSEIQSSKSNSNNRKARDTNRLNKVNSSIMNDKAGDLDPQIVELGAYVVSIASLIAIAKISSDIKYKRDQKNNRENNDKPMKKIKGSHSESQDMAAVNLGFNSGKLEHRMNCTMCSTAYDLRRKGYDVQANITTQGRRMKEVCKWYNLSDKDVTKTRSYNELVKQLESQPEGARGHVHSGCGEFDSRHSMVWEKKNGKIQIRDCQSNTLYKTIDQSIINKKSNIRYEFIRTDNAIINEELIRDAIVPRR